MKGTYNVLIGGYPFTVKFVPSSEIENCDGRTKHNDREILVRNDLDEISTTLVLRHEIVHALLGTQGRVYQNKFNVEEVCEFIAYRLSEIIDIEKQVCKQMKEQEDDLTI